MKSSRGIFKSLGCERGFSLIELVMVIIFLGVAFVATMGMMTSGVEKSVDTEVLTRAIMLAEQKMEEVRSDKNTLGYQYLIMQNYPDETNAGGSQGYSREIRFEDFANYKQVTVTVHHASIADVKLVAYLANY